MSTIHTTQTGEQINKTHTTLNSKNEQKKEKLYEIRDKQ